MRFFSLLLPLVLLVSCQSEPQQTATVVVKDGLGRTLTLPAHPRRVLALAPA